VPVAPLILKNLFARWFGSRRRRRNQTGAAAQLLQHGFRLQSAGDEAGAEADYRQALALDPAGADAHFLLGSLLGKQERLDAAERHLQQALAAQPAFADARQALGNVYLLRRDFDAAKACYAAAIALEPANAMAHSNLGLACQSLGDHAGALAAFTRAFELAPRLPDIVRNLTIERLQHEQYAQSEAHLRQLLNERPDDYEVLLSLGFTLQKMHRPQDALGYYLRARAQNGGDAELLNNLGIVLQELGRLDEAIENYSAAIAARPGFELALWHRALCYLLQHDFARGWNDYDLRLRSNDRQSRTATHPLWRGEDAGALRLLIYGEQGIGDEIMFASCLPQMIAASRHCVVECSQKLLPLFRRSFPRAQVLAASAPADLPVDAQIAMGSLPQYLRRNIEDFPRHSGYLFADPARIAAWRSRLAALGPGPRIGISWQGGTYKTRAPVRSIPLAQWAPLLALKGAHFVDLQYTDCSAEIAQVEGATGVPIHRWREAREDFEETAALVAALDLVVSVCTAVIHLGGALGRPVWVLAPHSPEWRYGARGETMPWYPSVRVFRQPAHGSWDSLIGDVAQSLHSWRDSVFNSQQPPHGE
jgi:tetratricopeptide (TPR) repeat protein